MRLLGYYKNGNYTVSIFDDGTKIRANKLDFFEPDTVESMDIKITNQCDRQCPFCHEASTPFGKHADILSPSFLDKLHPYTELAVGGGNPLAHPDLEEFLMKCKERKHIPNMTVNQVHFERDFDRIMDLVDRRLIYGLGVSLVKPTAEFVEKMKKVPNGVIHVINGIITEEELNILKNNELKVLILGYKEVRKGEKLYGRKKNEIECKKSMLSDLLPTILKEEWFRVVSFDNLAIKQLGVKSLMTQEEWDRFYMGDDGLDGQQTSATFFVDMTKREFAKNSCSMERYPLMDTAEEMLKFLMNK
jgi:organic radical activating enzyme